MKNDYYIIESLGSNDIKDGKIFYDCLKSVKKFNPLYKSIDTLDNFKDTLTEFANSDYKYLFLSAHGDEENIILTSEKVNAYDLIDIKIDLSKKRIFLSTCKGGSYLFGKYFIKKGAYSVIGAPDNLDQVVAVGMWSTMIILFEKYNTELLNFSKLDRALKFMNEIYEIDLAYYSFIKNKSKMKEYIYNLNNGRTRKDYEI